MVTEPIFINEQYPSRPRELSNTSRQQCSKLHCASARYRGLSLVVFCSLFASLPGDTLKIMRGYGNITSDLVIFVSCYGFRRSSIFPVSMVCRLLRFSLFLDEKRELLRFMSVCLCVHMCIS